MSIHKDNYTFKDRTWYIVPWRNIDPDLPPARKLPSLLIHDVGGYHPHRAHVWSYVYLRGDCSCSICGDKPSKRIQTLWTLENMDHPGFYDVISWLANEEPLCWACSQKVPDRVQAVMKLYEWDTDA